MIIRNGDKGYCPNKHRDEEIISLRKLGHSLQQIKDIHHLSRERIRQIIKKHERTEKYRSQIEGASA